MTDAGQTSHPSISIWGPSKGVPSSYASARRGGKGGGRVAGAKMNGEDKLRNSWSEMIDFPMQYTRRHSPYFLTPFDSYHNIILDA